MMGVIDIIILIFLGFGALIGFKRGFTRQIVSVLGIFVFIILSFLFKNPVSIFLYNNLPFFNFGGVFRDITVLNILLYEVIAFFSIFIVLSIVFRLVLSITKVFEKILNATIILGIPSKILGAILGVVQYVIYIFIILYVLSLPMFNISLIKNSKIANTILDKTPILANICNETYEIFNEIIELKKEYENTTDVNKFNQKALNLMIEKEIITRENVKILIKKGKIKNIVVE